MKDIEGETGELSARALQERVRRQLVIVLERIAVAVAAAAVVVIIVVVVVVS